MRPIIGRYLRTKIPGKEFELRQQSKQQMKEHVLNRNGWKPRVKQPIIHWVMNFWIFFWFFRMCLCPNFDSTWNHMNWTECSSHGLIIIIWKSWTPAFGPKCADQLLIKILIVENRLALVIRFLSEEIRKYVPTSSYGYSTNIPLFNAAIVISCSESSDNNSMLVKPGQFFWWSGHWLKNGRDRHCR